mmetsp:Transcript_35175/g.88497  ORF Transcript_35175/g.88497 Transcript_35175/m.88497 type:complete len:286 (-) Transcript_35175:1506-2363(-)
MTQLEGVFPIGASWQSDLITGDINRAQWLGNLIVLKVEEGRSFEATPALLPRLWREDILWTLEEPTFNSGFFQEIVLGHLLSTRVLDLFTETLDPLIFLLLGEGTQAELSLTLTGANHQGEGMLSTHLGIMHSRAVRDQEETLVLKATHLDLGQFGCGDVTEETLQFLLLLREYDQIVEQEEITLLRGSIRFPELQEWTFQYEFTMRFNQFQKVTRQTLLDLHQFLHMLSLSPRFVDEIGEILRLCERTSRGQPVLVSHRSVLQQLTEQQNIAWNTLQRHDKKVG